MTNRELELKACPFCGETPEIKKHFREAMWCMTHRCKVIGPISFDWASAPEIVAEAWNRRTEPAQAEPVAWIPVSERLPESRVKVLMAGVGGIVHVGHYEWQQGHTPDRFIYAGGNLPVENSGITHWHPLPPAPQQEQK